MGNLDQDDWRGYNGAWRRQGTGTAAKGRADTGSNHSCSAHKPGVLEKADELFRQLKEAGIRVKVDDSDQSAGWKFNQWEMKGVPVRLEIGPKDIENSQVVIVRRDDHEKSVLPMEGLTAAIKDTLNAVHKGLYERALAMRESKTVDAATFEQLKEGRLKMAL